MQNKNESIDKIIAIEWIMFTAVNEGYETADCQEDLVTFRGMRKAQFSAWSQESVNSYLLDLENAQSIGRNLVEEKYIHMMKTTEPIKYEALLERVAYPSETERSLANEISSILLDQTKSLFDNFPFVAGQGRPLFSEQDYGGISIETYQLGELMTYSEKTLTSLRDHIHKLNENGVSLARAILENTVHFYGYESLDVAEEAVMKHSGNQGIELSYGCECEDCEIC